MRFNNDDYLKAFPREERAAAAEKQIIKDKQPGNVLENAEKPALDPEQIPDDEGADQEGGGADGNE